MTNDQHTRDRASLLDMIEAIDRILVYMQDVDQQDFFANSEKQDAVLRRIIVLGEATKRVSSQFREQNFEIPW